MNYNLSLHNLELTPLDENFLDKKLSRLRKRVSNPHHLDIALRRDTHHRSGEIITCTMHLKTNVSKKRLHVERTASTVQDCLDEAIEALTHELEKAHDKAKDSHLT